MPEINIIITDKAGEEMKRIISLEKADHKENLPILGIQLRVVPGGCSGFSYEMRIVTESEADSDFVQVNGVNLDINEFSKLYLNGVTIDYTTSLKGTGFTFNNPNSSGSCGCGSSFSV